MHVDFGDSLFFEYLLWKEHQKQITVEWKIGPAREVQSKEFTMSLIMTVTQECLLTVAFKDAKGNPAKVESGEWSSSNPDIIKVFPDTADLTKCIVAPVGPTGTGQVNVKADARFGPEVKEVIGVLDVEIVGGEATVVEISAGVPQEQNPTATPQKKK
jgi:hypothetical protein